MLIIILGLKSVLKKVSFVLKVKYQSEYAKIVKISDKKRFNKYEEMNKECLKI